MLSFVRRSNYSIFFGPPITCDNNFTMMTRFFTLLSILLLLTMSVSSFSQSPIKAKAWVLDIDGAIGPATAAYFTRTLKEATMSNINLLILRIDTPGGLDSAMRDIIQAIIASPIPIVSYVSPAGARAASAGTYILYASHVAAMAPGTNLGAATPVQISSLQNPFSEADKDSPATPTAAKEEEKTAAKDTMTKKMVNDAEAYLRSLAQLRGRNVDWATQAVRESASLSAADALAKGVIDLIATDLTDLLTRLEGRQVKVQEKTQSLSTQGVIVEIREPNWRDRFLLVITDPNVAYLLMLIGIYGLFFEFYSPGTVVPGVVGGIALLMALLAFQILPINYGGLALILLGITFMISEAFLPSFGVVGLGGIIAFIIGSIILIDDGLPMDEMSFGISRPLIAGIALTTAIFFLFLIGLLIKTRRRPVVSGREQLIGAEGECLSNDDHKLRVYVRSEMWNAHSPLPLTPGQRVRVTAVNDLTLTVEAIEIESPAEIKSSQMVTQW